jgi:hypothetical protein
MIKTFPAETLERAIYKHHAFNSERPLLVVDSVYSLIDDDGAQDYFAKLAAEAKRQLGQWEENVIDCDKYARFVQTLGMLAHLKRPLSARQKSGLALGVFAYVSDSEGPHAINFMVTKVANTALLKVRFFEPQTGEEVHLSRTEKADILWAVL